MSDLNTALLIAAKAHAGQKRSNGTPYILHPIRVMMKMNTEEEMIVAALHDTIEDSDTVDENKFKTHGFSDRVITAVSTLTKIKGEDYEDYLNRVVDNKLARRVKIADLQDNMNLAELPKVDDYVLKRAAKYHGALKFLQEAEATLG